MNEDRIAGSAKDFAGRAQDAAGGLFGDPKTQAEGKARQAAGKAQDAMGQAQDFLEDAVHDQPIATLGIVAGLAFVLGFTLAKR